MDFFNMGDTIGYSQYNAIVYMLRKFKRLTSKLRLGQSIITSDYGSYNIIGGLISIEGNWILEDDVQIISNDCLLNCNYAFTFTVGDVNTSGTVNKREITFNGNTGDTGELNINIPSDSISSDEQILSDFRVDIVFDIHEYYTRPVSINVALSVDKPYISGGESATVTALLTDDNRTPIESHTVNFDVNGTIISKTTDSTGKATLTITGDGTQGLLDIKVINEKIMVIDAYFFDKNNNENWWNQNGDWNIRINDSFKHLLLTSNMERSYIPSTTPSIDSAPPLNELLSIPAPFCVEFDTDVVNYPNNIPSFVLWDTQGNIIFKFQLFMFKHYKIQIEDNTIKIWKNNEHIEYSLPLPEELYIGFYVESNKINAYVDFKDFMIYNISEPEPHDYSLSVAGTSIIQTGDNTTVTATLLDNGVAAVGETLNYEIKHGSTVIDSGSSATDSNGQTTINYTGTGIGDVDVIVSFGMSLQETYKIQDMVYMWDCLSDDGKWNWDTNMGHTHSSDGLTFYRSTGEGNICSKSTVTLPTDFEVEFTYMGGTLYSIETNWGGAGMTHDIRNQRTWYYYRECGNQNSSTLITVNETLSRGDVFKVRRENGVLFIYRNDVLKHSFTAPNPNYNYMELVGYINSRNSTIKDIKVKAL